MKTEATKPQFATKEFRRPITEILTDMAAPVPSRFISNRKQGGANIQYISWVNITKLLEFYAPGYDWKIEISYGGDRFYCVGRLTIKAAEGDFTREATGNEMSDLDKFGDPSSNAEAMALRRAAAKFGLGRHLWEK